MSILKVARMGHPVLRAQARPIEKGEIKSPELQLLINDMVDTMFEYSGVGLAAPQVHESVRVFVAMLDADGRGEGEATVFAAPILICSKTSPPAMPWSTGGKAA